MKAYNSKEKFSPPIVLDCEASGLHPTLSYPIEVGYVLPSEEIVSYLIRPEPEWDFWDKKAEDVHHIPREQLFDEGLPALEVAQRLASQLSGETVYSDAPDFEELWLHRLFDAARMEMYFDVDNLFHIFIQHQHSYFWASKKKLRCHVTPHRAGDDAWVLQQACIRSRQSAIDLHHNHK